MHRARRAKDIARLRRDTVLAAAIVQGALAAGCGDDARPARTGTAPAAAPVAAPAASPAPAPLDYAAPPDSAIPHDARGASIRRGLALVIRTTDSLPAQAPGNIQCASCHVDAGRRRDAAPLLGVRARYPRYMERAGTTVSLEERVNYCVMRSLAGTALPVAGRDMGDIVAYLDFLSTGVAPGRHVKGESIPKLVALTGDTARGAAIFAKTCSLCHGADGQGKPPAFPALWGPRSYSIGASMAREERAASFIRHFMPQNAPGSLTDQQAFDVSAFVNAHPRPDSPGKDRDWPKGAAPADVPYATVAHAAHRPPTRLIPRASIPGGKS